MRVDMSIEELRESFEDFSDHLPDHRTGNNKRYSVEEILFLTLTSVLCGAEGWRDIERFGKAKLEFLRTVFPFKSGVPSDDTLRRFFRALDPKAFGHCFVNWAKTITLPDQAHIAIDGKVSRHTFDGGGNPLHMVTAFASDCRLVLGQEKVADKSNEIKAIPHLLEVLDLEGAIVTIDAMGCQRDIAQAIVEKKADYVLSLKGNQGTLHKGVELIFKDKDLMKELIIDQADTVDGSEHGRLEKRHYRAINCPEVLTKQQAWPYLQSLVEVVSYREIKGVASEETRYYITSLAPVAAKIGRAIRAHWAIENSLHWILDMSFRDDDSRIRRGNAPQNIAVIKHMALNMLQKAKGKRDSIKQLRKAAGWENAQLIKILQQIALI